MMFVANKISLFQIAKLNKVARILYRCGKDMSSKYGLKHWDNSYLKTLLVVLWCMLKNDVYLVYDSANNPVATFQLRSDGEGLRFMKLATDPEYAGKGIGSFCMEYIENTAKEAGCKEVRLEVYEKSKHAFDFYEKRGYTVCGTVETLKYNELKMKKVIG